ncbi:protein SENESCENCE-ASSOCIATED GENE 21, mitochondrial-like [Bidens hawaiensis]|uniref:protein SENESCENCE-ASSOCIATED GENE 21, mitochondrial-like n=1 Tax=Bidens hawaiensis TaxID=980011 RepID=UPI00404A9A8F
MASVKRTSSFVVDQLSVVAVRRGYATATQGIVTGSSRGSGVAMMKKKASDQESKKSTPWVPDPVTGYYRPEGQTNEIDAAELREMLLKQKNRRN